MSVLRYIVIVLFQVVPAGGSSTMHVSFTPLTLSGPSSDARCEGFALGFMSLDSKVTYTPSAAASSCHVSLFMHLPGLMNAVVGIHSAEKVLKAQCVVYSCIWW